MTKLSAKQLKEISQEVVFVACDTGVGRDEAIRWTNRAKAQHKELSARLSNGWTARNAALAKKAQERLDALMSQIQRSIEYWGV